MVPHLVVPNSQPLFFLLALRRMWGKGGCILSQLVSDSHTLFFLLHPCLHSTGITKYFQEEIRRRRRRHLDGVVRVQICMVPHLVSVSHTLFFLLHPCLQSTGIMKYFRAEILRRRRRHLDGVVRVQICSVFSLAILRRRFSIVNRLCRYNLPLSRPRTPQFSINPTPQTRSRPTPINGEDVSSAVAASASTAPAPSLTPA
jgi:hypothetical protein